MKIKFHPDRIQSASEAKANDIAQKLIERVHETAKRVIPHDNIKLGDASLGNYDTYHHAEHLDFAHDKGKVELHENVRGGYSYGEAHDFDGRLEYDAASGALESMDMNIRDPYQGLGCSENELGYRFRNERGGLFRAFAPLHVYEFIPVDYNPAREVRRTVVHNLRTGTLTLIDPKFEPVSDREYAERLKTVHKLREDMTAAIERLDHDGKTSDKRFDEHVQVTEWFHRDAGTKQVTSYRCERAGSSGSHTVSYERKADGAEVFVVDQDYYNDVGSESTTYAVATSGVVTDRYTPTGISATELYYRIATRP